jgi:hypothetical protein
MGAAEMGMMQVTEESGKRSREAVKLESGIPKVSSTLLWSRWPTMRL